MSDADERERIRERKRRELRERTAGDGSGAGGEAGADAPAEPVHVEGQSHLDALVADHDVVLADFYADWCGPCKMLEPAVESVAGNTPAAVVEVDVDAHQALASQYQVSGVPTLVLFADGDPVDRVVGVQDEASLVALIEQYT